MTSSWGPAPSRQGITAGAGWPLLPATLRLTSGEAGGDKPRDYEVKWLSPDPGLTGIYTGPHFVQYYPVRRYLPFWSIKSHETTSVHFQHKTFSCYIQHCSECWKSKKLIKLLVDIILFHFCSHQRPVSVHRLPVQCGAQPRGLGVQPPGPRHGVDLLGQDPGQPRHQGGHGIQHGKHIGILQVTVWHNVKWAVR